MPKTVTSTEAKSQFGSLVKWATENQDEIVVKHYGEPTVVLLPFASYAELLDLREQARRDEAWRKLEALRREIQADNPVTDQAEAYREAGMSESVIREVLADDARRGLDG